MPAAAGTLPGDASFPTNGLMVIYDVMATIPGVELVVRRPVRPVDPNFTIGVTSLDWQPVGKPEMRGVPNPDPTLSRYIYSIQAFVKHSDVDEGLRLHAHLAKMIRVMLYRDADLRVRLPALTETELGVTERTQRWGVLRQNYMSNEVDGTWLHLSTTEFFLETETI